MVTAPSPAPQKMVTVTGKENCTENKCKTWLPQGEYRDVVEPKIKQLSRAIEDF